MKKIVLTLCMLTIGTSMFAPDSVEGFRWFANQLGKAQKEDQAVKHDNTSHEIEKKVDIKNLQNEKNYKNIRTNISYQGSLVGEHTGLITDIMTTFSVLRHAVTKAIPVSLQNRDVFWATICAAFTVLKISNFL